MCGRTVDMMNTFETPFLPMRSLQLSFMQMLNLTLNAQRPTRHWMIA